ncbi:hypothetical protein C5167_007821 [Papaver somniferum]|nr:hypothetical protein C5167_007821 [Papaver somniferum]
MSMVSLAATTVEESWKSNDDDGGDAGCGGGGRTVVKRWSSYLARCFNHSGGTVMAKAPEINPLRVTNTKVCATCSLSHSPTCNPQFQR